MVFICDECKQEFKTAEEAEDHAIGAGHGADY